MFFYKAWIAQNTPFKHSYLFLSVFTLARLTSNKCCRIVWQIHWKEWHSQSIFLCKISGYYKSYESKIIGYFLFTLQRKYVDSLVINQPISANQRFNWLKSCIYILTYVLARGESIGLNPKNLRGIEDATTEKVCTNIILIFVFQSVKTLARKRCL